MIRDISKMNLFSLTFFGIAVILCNSVPLSKNNQELHQLEVKPTANSGSEVYISDVTLFLYTPKNPTVPEAYPLDVQQVLSSSNFDGSKPNIFSVHGYESNYTDGFNFAVRDAFLASHDVNFFSVDWSCVSKRDFYEAADNMEEIASFLAKFIKELQGTLGIGPEYFTLLGFSFGAHLIGTTGRMIDGNIGTIVALDSASLPFYSFFSQSRLRLRKTDAQFVQAIHTNDYFMGYGNSVGHVDIKVNGGIYQPKCGMTGCSHARSYTYYAESLTSGGFKAWKCDSYQRFKNNECNDRPTTRLGGFPIDNTASGTYYLTTNSDPPYSSA